MKSLNLILTVSLLLLPLVFSLFYRPRPEDLAQQRVHPGRVRRLRRRLYRWTGVALWAYLVLGFMRDSALLTWWKDLPWIMNLGKPLHELMWLAFFPLWFAIAMPLLVACRPEAATPYPRATRTALLVPRDRSPVVPKLAWAGLAVLCFATLSACLLHWPAQVHKATTLGVLLLVMLASLLLSMLSAGAVLREAEPLDPAGSPELRAAYARLRQAKAWGFFGLCASLMLLLAGMAFMTAFELERAFVYVAAVGGSLIGIGGAAFGVVMSNRRMAIKRRLDELCR